MDVYDLVGLLGVFLTIYCYARVQWRRDYAKTLSYSLTNLAGALLFSVSFIQHWNLSSFVCNTIWGLISVYGLYRCLKYMWIAREQARIVEGRLAQKPAGNA